MNYIYGSVVDKPYRTNVNVGSFVMLCVDTARRVWGSLNLLILGETGLWSTLDYIFFWICKAVSHNYPK